MERWTLLTEKNLKLLVIGICWVFLLQCLFGGTGETKAEEVEEVAQVSTWDELHKCKHWDWEIYRGVKWRCNADGLAQDMPDLQGSTREERMRELLAYYGKEYLYETFFYGGKMFGVYPELAICIAKADTSLGRFTKSQNNLGNVGNNDRWDIVNFDSEYKAVKAIYQTLNNQHLWGYQYVAELSRKFNKTGKIYAWSEDNWHNNVTNCMSVIRGETIDDWFAFRF